MKILETFICEKGKSIINEKIKTKEVDLERLERSSSAILTNGDTSEIMFGLVIGASLIGSVYFDIYSQPE